VTPVTMIRGAIKSAVTAIGNASDTQSTITAANTAAR